jgi:CheY-like chemotaxis protein
MSPTTTTQPTTEPERNRADSVPAPIVSPGTPFPLSSEETPSPSQDYFTAPEFLLVDDNFINLKILTSYMKKLKQPYQTATNGQEALSAYEMDSGRYVCILMDISMPIMDGFEATRRIRAFEQRHGLRPALILALTGLASEEAQREAMVSGVDLFLTKPVRLKELGPILRSRGVIPEEK